MAVSYDQPAGQGVERLAALSDGVFAVAMTLLVLDLRVPAMEAMHSERELWRAPVALSPRLVMYMMSFMTLGIFWIGQQTQLNISQVPHRTSRLLVNILLSGSTLHFSWLCALGTGLVKHDLPPEVSLAVKRRIVVAQSLYAFGALLCVFSIYWSIAFIVLVQLSVVIAPFGRRSRS